VTDDGSADRGPAARTGRRARARAARRAQARPGRRRARPSRAPAADPRECLEQRAEGRALVGRRCPSSRTRAACRAPEAGGGGAVGGECWPQPHAGPSGRSPSSAAERCRRRGGGRRPRRAPARARTRARAARPRRPARSTAPMPHRRGQVRDLVVPRPQRPRERERRAHVPAERDRAEQETHGGESSRPGTPRARQTFEVGTMQLSSVK
jgi:hypothetical protein